MTIDWAPVLNTAISFALGASASWVIAWFFYRRQLKDQEERDRQAYRQRLEDQKRAYEEKQFEQAEQERQIQRTRMYQKRLAMFQGYDRSTGWAVDPLSDGSNRVTIRNFTGVDFHTLEIHLPTEDSSFSVYHGSKPIAVFQDIKAGFSSTVTLPKPIDDIEFVECRGYSCTTTAPYQERVPLDPNITMPEYRNQP